MNLVLSVIEDPNIVADVMIELRNSGVNGATVIDSYGMGRILSKAQRDESSKEVVNYVLSQNRPTNRTIFVVVSDEKLESTLDIFRKNVGDFSTPRTGILFTIKLDKVFM